MMNKLFAAATLCFLLVFQTGAFAQESRALPALPDYECLFTADEITVDGHITEAAWAAAPRTERFGEIRSGEALPFDTYVKMLWTERGLYVAYYLEQEDIWATISDRDAFSYYDNDAEIFFDPDGDGLDYLEIEMTALNQVYDIHWDTRLTWGDDALVNPPGTWNIHFDFKGLEHAMQYDGTLNYSRDKDKAWTIELFFPWESFAEYANMPLPPNENDMWRMNFYRCEYDSRSRKSADSYTWSAPGKVNMHIPERFGRVHFVKKEK